MTQRHAGYLVTLEEDIREDEAQEIITALKMVKFVHSVEPVPTGGAIDYQITKNRRDSLWIAKLRELIREGPAK
jgi:chromosome segregation and condensation protein ScpB